MATTLLIMPCTVSVVTKIISTRNVAQTMQFTAADRQQAPSNTWDAAYQAITAAIPCTMVAKNRKPSDPRSYRIKLRSFQSTNRNGPRKIMTQNRMVERITFPTDFFCFTHIPPFRHFTTENSKME